MSGSTFTWVGGADSNGANNWTTPANWSVGGVRATRVPDAAADIAVISVDDGAKDAIISAGQSITVASLTIGDTAGGAQGGHVVVGGSSGPRAVGGGGGGTLTSVGAITITSPNSGGAIVGGKNGVVTAPSMTVNGGPGVLIGGGGTFDIATLVNNGGILADGGYFDLGPLVLNSGTISGTGFMEVSGYSTLEINAATAQELRVAVNQGQTAAVVLDRPGNFTGSLNLLNANSDVDLFLKGETPTSVAYDPVGKDLVVNGAGGAVLNRIPFTSLSAEPLAVVTSTRPGFGEVAIGIPVMASSEFDKAYYLAQNPDVAAAGVDPFTHFDTVGWKEGRNPDAFFNVNYYLNQNPDVAAAHIDPLTHYETVGWKEGRDPSVMFSTSAYLQANPDVAAAHVDPLMQYLQYGALEGRMAFMATPRAAGPQNPLVDNSYYFSQNADVAAAGLDPFAHYDSIGWKEGRNPDALFDTKYYLLQNPDVAAAGIDPMLHYETTGWKEGRNPSAAFSTPKYLAANPDVKAAGVNPLVQYEQYGMHEGRAIYPV